MKNSSVILVTGPSSALGGSTIRLLSPHAKLITLSRRPLPPAPSDQVIADLTDLEGTRTALKEYPRIDCLIHIAGVTDAHAYSHKLSLEDNIVMARNLSRLAKERKIRRMIFISSNSVNYSSRRYAQTKREAEKILTDSNIPTTIFRPTLLLSDRSPELTNLIKTIRRLPVIPLVNHGKHLIQPVAVSDVAEAIVKSVLDDKTKGKIYTLAGSKTISQKELVDLISAKININKPTVHLPLSLAKFIFSACSAFQPGLFSSLQDTLLKDITADCSEIKKDLFWQPQDPRSVLARLLS